MKKLLKLMLIAMFMFSACGKDGKDGKDTVLIVLDFHVPSSTTKWESAIDDLMGDFFECRVSVREITGDVFDNGVVLCYLVQYIEYGNTVTPIQTPLPYTYSRWEHLYDEEYEEYHWYNYSENYTFEVSPGYINFIVKSSDLGLSEGTLSCTFRVVIMR